ncbi:hydrolase [Burkholderia anthinoferrum]|uniref:hydrolase n=1 Tax=Burkholderia anthinoferrum TaxID=3090833 RepID=UPI001C66B87D|nr:hydrolase [Burkholderia anthinoferrum]
MFKHKFLGYLARISVMLFACASMQSMAAPPETPYPKPVYDQLTPDNSSLLLIDFQPQYVFATQSSSIDTLLNNAAALAEVAQTFKLPTVITTITSKAYGGPLLPQIRDAAPGVPVIDRTPINAWQDARVRDAVHRAGRKKLLIAGLWTDNCVMLPALAALKEGYEVYVVTDASGDSDPISHERAIQRLVQAGAVPITWLPVLLELQADWTRDATHGAVAKILAQHAATMGIGALYKRSMQTP